MILSPGPVFVYECIAMSRRWQLYAVRALVVLGLLGAMFLIWTTNVATYNLSSIRAQAAVGESYFYAIIGTQIALVMLAAPAFTAGSICLDRARGTLTHMMVTDLRDSEIVLGKLGARLMPVVGLVALGLPVMSLGTLLGGIDPDVMALSFLVSLAVAILSCSLALAISTWATKTQEVLMATYMFWVVVLLIHPIWSSLAVSGLGVTGPPRWLLKANPFWMALSPYMAPNQVELASFVWYVVIALGVSAILAGVSVLGLRRATLRQTGRAAGSRKVRDRLGLVARLVRLLPGPSLDRNPVLWREWHRSRPSFLGRVIWYTFALGITIGGVASMVDFARHGVTVGAPNVGIFVILLGVAIGLLLLSVSSATVLSEERTRDSLDVLLATPLPTRTIVWGKWWGAYRYVPLLAFWPVAIVAAEAFSYHAPRPAAWVNMPNSEYGFATRIYAVVAVGFTILAHGAAITSLGLALATWIRKQGRAIALNVAAVVMVEVGWIVLIMVLVRGGPGRWGESLASLSCIFSTVELCERLAFGNREIGWTLACATVWALIVAGTALLLLLAVFATFNRCLGRVSDWNDEFRFAPELPPYGKKLSAPLPPSVTFLDDRDAAVAAAAAWGERPLTGSGSRTL